MAQNWHTPHIADIEAQIRWEMEAVQRGVERAREAAKVQQVADTDVGTSVMRRLVPALAARIKAKQEEAQAAILAAQRGRPQLWWWMVQMLDAESLAVITIRTLFTATPRDLTFNRPITYVARNINRSVVLEVEYSDWKVEQQKLPKDQNLFLKFLRSTKQVDAKAFKRFSEKYQIKRDQKWDMSTGITFGVWLLNELAETAPDWFSIKTVRTRTGLSEVQFAFSEEAKERICDLTEQSELNRPLNLPMTCPPADWRLA